MMPRTSPSSQVRRAHPRTPSFPRMHRRGRDDMLMRIVAGKFAQLAFGALIGAIIGGIVTGDEMYILYISLGIPFVILVFVVIGAVGTARRGRAKKAASLAAPTGINATLTGGAA